MLRNPPVALRRIIQRRDDPSRRRASRSLTRLRSPRPPRCSAQRASSRRPSQNRIRASGAPTRNSHKTLHLPHARVRRPVQSAPLVAPFPPRTAVDGAPTTPPRARDIRSSRAARAPPASRRRAAPDAWSVGGRVIWPRPTRPPRDAPRRTRAACRLRRQSS